MNKNGWARSKKVVKTLMTFFRKIEVLTENTTHYDVHYGPSIMSQGETPWKDPRGGFRGVFPWDIIDVYG